MLLTDYYCYTYCARATGAQLILGSISLVFQKQLLGQSLLLLDNKTIINIYYAILSFQTLSCILAAYAGTVTLFQFLNIIVQYVYFYIPLAARRKCINIFVIVSLYTLTPVHYQLFVFNILITQKDNNFYNNNYALATYYVLSKRKIVIIVKIYNQNINCQTTFLRIITRLLLQLKKNYQLL